MMESRPRPLQLVDVAPRSPKPQSLEQTSIPADVAAVGLLESPSAWPDGLRGLPTIVRWPF